MQKFFSIFIVTLLTLGLFMNDAEAKRFGGGRSFGMQRSFNSSSMNNSRFANSRPNTPHTAPTRQPNRWLGPLTGFLAGGLLASLFMHNGIGSGLLAWLAIGTVLLLVFKMLQGRTRPSYQTNNTQQPVYDLHPSHYFNQSAEASYGANNNFNEASFLRDAKVIFLRLQAANDSKNLADIREYTTPQIFAEIQLQLQERGDEENITIVDKLEAALLEVADENNATVASVRFTGSIREDNITSLLNEIWNFRKQGNDWLVCGIQQ